MLVHSTCELVVQHAEDKYDCFFLPLMIKLLLCHFPVVVVIHFSLQELLLPDTF